MIKTWDPLLRLFHWSLVASIALAWLTSEGGGVWHEWVGYGALGLIGFRLIWGVIGPRYARFSQFLRHPQQVIDYARAVLGNRDKRYIGHNPLGGAMVVALLVTVAATGITGWLMVQPGQGAGPGLMKDVHEMLANLMLLLVFAHVAGVVHASRRHKENLVRAMLTGLKPAPGAGDIA